MPEQTYFEARERALLGARYDEVYRPQGEVRRALTRNALRCSEARFLQLMGPSVCRAPFCADSFYLLDETARPGKSPLYHAGTYYVQEASAAAPAPLLDVQPGQRVLDMCAAPGGKSAQLAGALGGRGLLVANEYDAARANILKSNLERMGVANAVVLNEAPARIAAALPGWFDRVLVDAPCSGEGMFRKEPQAVRQHSQALVQRCAALGAQILDAAAAALRPGGRLVYSTCTFAPEEDEAQVGAFLARHAEFFTVPCSVGFGSPGEAARCGEHPFCAQHTRRIYPCHGGEGHFMAVLEKSAAAPWPGPGQGGQSRKGGPGRHSRGAGLSAGIFSAAGRRARGPANVWQRRAPAGAGRLSARHTAARGARRRARGQRGKGPLRARARAVYGLWGAVRKPRRAAARQPALRRMAAGRGYPGPHGARRVGGRHGGGPAPGLWQGKRRHGEKPIPQGPAQPGLKRRNLG